MKCRNCNGKGYVQGEHDHLWSDPCPSCAPAELVKEAEQRNAQESARQRYNLSLLAEVCEWATRLSSSTPT